jgi:hypothetical protein
MRVSPPVDALFGQPICGRARSLAAGEARDLHDRQQQRGDKAKIAEACTSRQGAGPRGGSCRPASPRRSRPWPAPAAAAGQERNRSASDVIGAPCQPEPCWRLTGSLASTASSSASTRAASGKPSATQRPRPSQDARDFRPGLDPARDDLAALEREYRDGPARSGRCRARSAAAGRSPVRAPSR